MLPEPRASQRWQRGTAYGRVAFQRECGNIHYCWADDETDAQALGQGEVRSWREGVGSTERNRGNTKLITWAALK